MTRSSPIAARKKALVDDVRAAIRDGVFPVGSALPTLRELSEKYSISVPIALRQLEPLMTEGLLESIPRQGIFVAARTSSDTCFILVARDPGGRENEWRHTQPVRRGFERRLGQLGASSMLVLDEQLNSPNFRTSLPPTAGVFYFLARPDRVWPPRPMPPCVRYGYRQGYPSSPSSSACDWVHFDDREAGRKATRHLIQHGHRRIGFLAAHSIPLVWPQQWSAEREAGWREVLGQAFPDSEPVSFHLTPEELKNRPPGVADGRRLADRAVPMIDQFDAFVGADDTFLLGLIDAARAAGVPPGDWPAMVGSEGLPEARNHGLTSIIPNWEEIGSTAADILWDRHCGHLRGPAVQRDVAVDLATRLSSRRDWNRDNRAEALVSQH